MNYELENDPVKGFADYLRNEERSSSTISKYVHDIKVFYTYLDGEPVITKEKVIGYKEYLGSRYQVSSANSMLAAVNKFLAWSGFNHCQVKSFKAQKQIFSDRSRELDQSDYKRLVATARKQGRNRLEMIMQTICGTGIRVGELSYITVEAVMKGEARVSGKGKRRIVFITSQLRTYLLKYCRKNQIKSGAVFVTRSGKQVDRSNIWTEMKRLCEEAGVDPQKVFPHNLRHLFARVCYRKKKDIVYLADILGHSSIDTTRIYTISSGQEHKKMLASLGLLV